MDATHVMNVSYLCRPMNESAGGGIYVPVPPCYDSCHASDVPSIINTISLLSFFIAIIPSILISMFFHRYYVKNIWQKYNGHLPPTDKVNDSRKLNKSFIFKHTLKGITLGGIFSSIFISIYISFLSNYGFCADLEGTSSNIALIWWIFIWTVGLISFFIVWHLNIQYDIIWDDPIGFKLAKFIILQITAMIIGIIYSQTVNIGDLYKERGVYGSVLVSANCVCNNTDSLAFQIASFIVILFAAIIFRSYKKAQILLTCSAMCCLGPIIILLTVFILFSRFQSYNKKVKGISGFNIDGGDLFLLWCIFNLFLFGSSGIYKLIKNDKKKEQQFKPHLVINDSEPVINAANVQQSQPIYVNNFAPIALVDTSLPFGWQKLMTNDGKIYYQSHVTKQTQWERPIY